MITALDLLLKDHHELERMVIAHFTGLCDECRAYSPSQWSMLCATHAPIARAIIDPDYTKTLRRQLAAHQTIIADCNTTIALRERIVKGEQWLREQHEPEQITRGKAKLKQLRSEELEAHRRVTTESLRQLVERHDGLLAFYEERLALLEREVPRVVHMDVAA